MNTNGYEAIINTTLYIARATEMEAESGSRRGALHQLKGLQLNCTYHEGVHVYIHVAQLIVLCIIE